MKTHSTCKHILNFTNTMIPNDKKNIYIELLQCKIQKLQQDEEMAANPITDKHGEYSSRLARSYRAIGVVEYLLNGNIAVVRTTFAKSVPLRLSQFKRFTAGEPIDVSYVTMNAYQYVFDALAAGNYNVANEIAYLMDGTETLKKLAVHPFARAMAYALKNIFMQNGTGEVWDKLNERIGRKKTFIGYTIIFDAILKKNHEQFNRGLRDIIKGHVAESKRGIFRCTDDAFLCVWGLGLANFAEKHGISANINDDLLPSELIIRSGPRRANQSTAFASVPS